MNYYRNILASDYEAIEAYEEEQGLIDELCIEEMEEMFSYSENNFA